MNAVSLLIVCIDHIDYLIHYSGYYLATLEAASQHICDLAEQYEKVANIETMFTEEEDVFEYFDKKA